MSRFAMVVSLGIVLILGQVFKLHMHIQHAEASSEHIVVVHSAIVLHDLPYSNPLDTADHHHVAEIDISPDSAVIKAKLLYPFLLLILFASLFLFLPKTLCFCRWYSVYAKPAVLYYLFYPPLRGPPENKFPC